MTRQHTLIMPDLGMGAQPILTTLWLVEPGSEVSEGDRLLEVVCGVAVVDLPSPASGVLREQFVSEDQVVSPGQSLGVVEEREGENRE